MIVTTTPTVPDKYIVGVVTANVNCLRAYQFEFDQDIMDELNKKLVEQAKAVGSTAIVGVSYQLFMPVIHGSVSFKMTAIGTAVRG